MKRLARGFTLLELMVVLAVLGVLAIVVSQALPFILGRVRDARRINALVDLQRVIELYQADTGAYPIGGASGTYIYATADNSDPFTASMAPYAVAPGSLQAPTNTYIPAVTPNYYDILPLDPLPGAATDPACAGSSRNYIYISDGQHYKLIFNCADEEGIDPSDQFVDPPSCVGSFCTAWAVSDDMDCVTSEVVPPCSGYGWP